MNYNHTSNTVKILHQLMTKVGINTYLQLSRESKVSELQFYRLENNLVDNLPLGILKKIATTLNISVTTLIEYFISDDNLSSDFNSINNQKLTSDSKEEYQQETINILESLLLQLPTVIHAVNNNPDIPASRILPLLHPLNELLLSWEIESIGSVGEIVDYNPQYHELIDSNELDVKKVNQVEIRYVGYRQKDKLLYRAKVSNYCA